MGRLRLIQCLKHSQRWSHAVAVRKPPDPHHLAGSEHLLSKVKRADESLEAWRECLALRDVQKTEKGIDLPATQLLQLIKVGCKLASEKMSEDVYALHQLQLRDLVQNIVPRTHPFALKLSAEADSAIVAEAADAYLTVLFRKGTLKRASARPLAGVRMRYLRQTLLYSALHAPTSSHRAQIHSWISTYVGRLANNFHARNASRTLHILQLLNNANLPLPPVSSLLKVFSSLPEPSSQFFTSFARRQHLYKALAYSLMENSSPRNAPLTRSDEPLNRLDVAIKMLLRLHERYQLSLEERIDLVRNLYNSSDLPGRSSISSLTEKLAIWREYDRKPETFLARISLSTHLLNLSIKMRWMSLSAFLYHRILTRGTSKGLKIARDKLEMGKPVHNGRDAPFHPFVFLLRALVRHHQLYNAPMLPLSLWNAFPISPSVKELAKPIYFPFLASLGSFNFIVQFLNAEPSLRDAEKDLLLSKVIQSGRLLVSFRTLRRLTDSSSVILSYQDVYLALLKLISTTHSRRIKLFRHIFYNMPHQPTATAYLYLMRLYSRRWDANKRDFDMLHQIKLEMVEVGLAPDDRHQGEIIYLLARRGALAQAATLFLRVQDPSKVSTLIVGLLACRLADARLFEEARLVIHKWRSVQPPRSVAIGVSSNEKTIIVADLFLAARQAGEQKMDAKMLEQLGITTDKAVGRLEKRLREAYAGH